MCLSPLPVHRKLAPTPETASFEQIFRDHYHDLCRYAFAITKARNKAEAAVEALPPLGKSIFSMSRDDRRMIYQEMARTPVPSVKTVKAHMGRSLETLAARQHAVMP